LVTVHSINVTAPGNAAIHSPTSGFHLENYSFMPLTVHQSSIAKPRQKLLKPRLNQEKVRSTLASSIFIQPNSGIVQSLSSTIFISNSVEPKKKHPNEIDG
jgi:hypothetical protein